MWQYPTLKDDLSYCLNINRYLLNLDNLLLQLERVFWIVFISITKRTLKFNMWCNTCPPCSMCIADVTTNNKYNIRHIIICFIFPVYIYNIPIVMKNGYIIFLTFKSKMFSCLIMTHLSSFHF